MNLKNKDKLFVVYRHTNKINGKVYIGQSCDVLDRWRCNGKNYFNSPKFFNAIKKYGWDNFTHEILYSNLDQTTADFIEKKLIAKYDSIKNGYNLKEGGARGKLSEESLKKMGDSVRRGFKEHPERGKKISKALRGRKGSPQESRNKSLASYKSILIDIDGEIGSLRYWSERTGIAKGTISKTIKKYGMETAIERIKYKLDTGLSWSMKFIKDKSKGLI